MKFGRNYIFDVQASDGSMISVTYPMTLEFAVRKDINPSANTGTFRLYNLDQLTRNRIYKDHNCAPPVRIPRSAYPGADPNVCRHILSDRFQ